MSSPSKRYLTKSRFKVGSECATKLFYLDKSGYGNSKTDDSFLRALAEGGFQVGELAKLYFPEGIEVTEKSNQDAIHKTAELLKRDKVTIFEAAICYEDFLVRVDVLRKQGNTVELIEVKAKSYNPKDSDQFFAKRTKKPTMKSDWKPYLLDVAFQTFVLTKAHPEFDVTPFLMLADKSKTATVEGLNQRFLIERDSNGRSKVTVDPSANSESVGQRILCQIKVTGPVVHILHEEEYPEGSFEKFATAMASLVEGKRKANPVISSECKSCEFRIDKSKFPDEVKSGFHECFAEAIGMKQSDLARPLVFDVWNFRKSQALLEEGCHYMDQITEDDLSVKEAEGRGLSSSQRQWIQVEKEQNRDSTPYIDLDGLRTEIGSWTYPLHFIDFETTMSALPFNSGRRPYEQIAFQFSHHKVNEDGTIEHANQYINRNRGEFPNFAFVRALKATLEKDAGTILRYSHHENSVLCQIIKQLESSQERDSEELISWIKSITTSSGADKDALTWAGQRSMVDLCELVKLYYYSPATKGSNSIKMVLPAILADSPFLANKYSKPLYGNEDGIRSLNFKDWTWLHFDSDGRIRDPYKLLPPIFSDKELETIEPLVNSAEIADGGAAMMAYAMMQFSQMSEIEAQRIQDSLLKYCELDTLAMVMIFEYWADKIGLSNTNKAA